MVSMLNELRASKTCSLAFAALSIVYTYIEVRLKIKTTIIGIYLKFYI